MTTTLQLAPRALHALRNHPPLELSCQRGALWITQAGEAGDVVLEPGQRVRLPANPHTVLQVLGTQEVVVRVAPVAGLPAARAG